MTLSSLVQLAASTTATRRRRLVLKSAPRRHGSSPKKLLWSARVWSCLGRRIRYSSSPFGEEAVGENAGASRGHRFEVVEGSAVFVACSTQCFARHPLERALRIINELEFSKVD